ncbi:tyrosine phosphatase family-domain-containing protein [Rhexocercosporidium sp. MPI-PUGE-AT-0058]|nr:tyrosine phosphatase family-domain-containing protein [Rhexocercosporidium sp. MPI-PUGE-AT-0058]
MGSTEIKSEMSRRSTRLFVEEQEFVDRSNITLSSSSRESSVDGNEKVHQCKTQSTIAGVETTQPSTQSSTASLSRSLDTFPPSSEEFGLHITDNLQAAKVTTKAKEDGRPVNFGVVVPSKIFRSSWPMVEDFQYLETLRLKTVISLVKKDFGPEFKGFLKNNQIQHKVIDMPGTKKVEITQELMQSIMEIVLDEANHPILIHCNHGKHRTGCAVAVIRHVAQWDVQAIVEEYRGYAEPKVRECDLQYIAGFDISCLRNLFTRQATPSNITDRDRKILKFFILAAIVLIIWIASLSWASHWKLCSQI